MNIKKDFKLLLFSLIVFSACTKNNFSEKNIYSSKFSSSHSIPDSAQLSSFSISDSCDYCSGEIFVWLFKKEKFKEVQLLNKQIIDSLINKNENSKYSVKDFQDERIFDSDNCIGISTRVLININSNSLLSFSSKSEGVCGTSISDYFPNYHLNIDLYKGKVLKLNDIFLERAIESVEQFVRDYSESNKIVNLPYWCLECKEEELNHVKLSYLLGLSDQFYIKDGYLGLYTLVLDESPEGSYRNDADRKFYMLVEVPINKLQECINPKTSVFNLLRSK